MSWPWISRKHHIARCEELTVANAVATSQRDAARAAGEDCAHRLAACDLARVEIKANFAKLAALSRALETKLRDCTDPPITRKELEKLTKLVSVLRSENEGLRKHVLRSDELAERLQERIRAVDETG